MDRNLPSTIRTDVKRLRQILQNLLSNAFKFTAKGAVSLEASIAKGGWTLGHSRLDQAEGVVAFSVIDTGIGIPEDKQQIIFEAFQQADGTTSRHFGGTGLGLSISSELARLLGGEIRVASGIGKGSTFTLYLPIDYKSDGGDVDAVEVGPDRQYEPEHPVAGEARQQRLRVEFSAGKSADQRDDRNNIRPGDRVALVVEEDAKFAARLLDVIRESSLMGLHAPNAHTALALTNEFTPDAIVIDIKRRDEDGWAILNLLKQDPETRHIPVNVISVDDKEDKYTWMGVLGFVHKPSREETLREALSRSRRLMEHDPRALLVAAGSKAQREGIIEAVARDGLRVITASTGKQALKVLKRKTGIDCVIIGQSLADMAPIDFVREIVQTGCIKQMPIVIHTVEGLGGRAEQGNVNERAEILLLKQVQAPEAILEETALCLQQATKDLPPGQRESLPSSQKTAPALSGRRVLVVDDDIRNIFALTSALEQEGVVALNAENGLDAIEMLKKSPDIDIILMDLMMPEQDGYHTIRIIRSLERFRNVPIIGVTAKAMKGDREKCIEAGASDYIPKPVNLDQLLSVMRMWLAD
jgi:CheY-like chemotaxis protein